MDLERAEIPRTLSVDQEPQVRKNAFAGSSARILTVSELNSFHTVPSAFGETRLSDAEISETGIQ